VKSTCKVTGILGFLLGMALMVAPAAAVSAQQTQDSSSIRPTAADSIAYSDSLVRPGYGALLEDTTGGLGAAGLTDTNRIPTYGDTASEMGGGGGGGGGIGGVDTTGIPSRRSGDSTSGKQ
jgi:hypothetical protein